MRSESLCYSIASANQEFLVPYPNKRQISFQQFIQQIGHRDVAYITLINYSQRNSETIQATGSRILWTVVVLDL